MTQSTFSSIRSTSRSLTPRCSRMSGYRAWKAGSAGTRIVLANGLGTSTRSLPLGVADAPDRLVSASSRSASSCCTRS
ncbi:Uncharacterised protein [Bordetella pertussis]|nr:Uncharacterised protein [Bordetella pertussis]CFT99922.1 Uncharacterised protein [Bordetella pertussis]